MTPPGPKGVAPPPMTAFRELIRTFGLLERVMYPYFARFGITGAQWGVLRNLHRNEEHGLGGMRFSELSEQLLIRPPSVTTVVDRLERAGLVRRESVPTDLRGKHVVLTDKGRQLIERVLLVHDRQIASVMGALDGGEEKQLQLLLNQLGRHLEKMLEQGEAGHHKGFEETAGKNGSAHGRSYR
jgi:DNA-binding MarR family transcriptional regulator